MRLLWTSPLLVLAACAAPASEPAPDTTVAGTTPQPAKVCYEDVPTGTRFSRIKCYTPEQDAARLKAGSQAAEELGKVRHGPLQDPR